MASVNKRKWKKPDGSIGEAWAVRYFDETGARRSKTFDLKKDADAFRRKVEREIEDGTHVAPTASKRLKDVLDEFLADTECRRKSGIIGEGHCRRQAMVCRVYLAPAMGQVAARDLNIEHVAKLRRTMLEKGLHPRSVKQYLNTLQMVEQFARRRGYLKTQPVTDALSDLLRGTPAFSVETFKAEEVTQLLQAAPARAHGRPLRTAAFMGCAVALAALAGLRAGEILGLHADNVDLDARVLRVRHNLTSYREIKGPKTAAGRRTVPLPAQVVDMLRHWRDGFQIANEQGLFFTTSQGKAFTYGALHMAWTRLLDREGVPTRHFHALRHFYASWLLMHGMPMAEVSRMLGHSSHQMTLQVYTHAMMNDADASSRVDRIAGLLPVRDARVTHGALNA